MFLFTRLLGKHKIVVEFAIQDPGTWLDQRGMEAVQLIDKFQAWHNHDGTVYSAAFATLKQLTMTQLKKDQKVGKENAIRTETVHV